MDIRLPFDIRFLNLREIRMGSPYLMASIKIEDDTPVKLPDNIPWQNICAWSTDTKFLALVEFDLMQNEPGFHFIVYNTSTGKFIRSERIFGLVNAMTFASTGRLIHYNKFLYTGQRSEDGQLLGNSDQVWSFQDFN